MLQPKMSLLFYNFMGRLAIWASWGLCVRTRGPGTQPSECMQCAAKHC